MIVTIRKFVRRYPWFVVLGGIFAVGAVLPDIAREPPKDDAWQKFEATAMACRSGFAKWQTNRFDGKPLEPCTDAEQAANELAQRYPDDAGIRAAMSKCEEAFDNTTFVYRNSEHVPSALLFTGPPTRPDLEACLSSAKSVAKGAGFAILADLEQKSVPQAATSVPQPSPEAKAAVDQGVAAPDDTPEPNPPTNTSAACDGTLVPGCDSEDRSDQGTSRFLAKPVWKRTPSAEAISRYYPEAAALAGTGGLAQVRCTSNARGELEDCRITHEDPEGLGFGPALLEASKLFKLKLTQSDGKSPAGAEVELKMGFRAPS
jgi:hypothetical protein